MPVNRWARWRYFISLGSPFVLVLGVVRAVGMEVTCLLGLLFPTLLVPSNQPGAYFCRHPCPESMVRDLCRCFCSLAQDVLGIEGWAGMATEGSRPWQCA